MSQIIVEKNEAVEKQIEAFREMSQSPELTIKGDKKMKNLRLFGTGLLMSAVLANGLWADGHIDCKDGSCVMTDGGISVYYEKGEWPQKVEGVWFDFSRVANSEKLTQKEKETLSKNANLTALFILWATQFDKNGDEKTPRVMIDRNGNEEMKGKRRELIFLSTATTLQNLMTRDLATFKELQAKFVKEFLKGKAGDLLSPYSYQIAEQSPFWYECKETKNGTKAVAEYTSVEFEKLVRGQKINEFRKSDSSEMIDAVEFGASSDEKGKYVSFANEISEKAGNLIWIDGVSSDNQVVKTATFAPSADGCLGLKPSEIESGYLIDPRNSKVTKMQLDQHIGLLYDPSRECKAYLAKTIYSKNESIGFKELYKIKGKEVPSNIRIFSEGIDPKSVYATSEELCTGIYKNGGLNTPTGKISIQNDAMYKAAVEEKEASLIGKYFPNGLWKSSKDGTCSSIDKDTLVANAISFEKSQNNGDNTLCSLSFALTSNLIAQSSIVLKKTSGSKVFAGALVTFASLGTAALKMKKDDFMDIERWSFIGCNRAIDDSKDLSKPFSDRTLTFVAESKDQCELMAKDHATLDNETFSKKYLRLDTQSTKK